MTLAQFMAEVNEQMASGKDGKKEKTDKQEKENRTLRREACGQFPSVKLLPCGSKKFVTNLCGDYRMCDNCAGS